MPGVDGDDRLGHRLEDDRHLLAVPLQAGGPGLDLGRHDVEGADQAADGPGDDRPDDVELPPCRNASRPFATPARARDHRQATNAAPPNPDRRQADDGGLHRSPRHSRPARSSPPGSGPWPVHPIPVRSQYRRRARNGQPAARPSRGGGTLVAVEVSEHGRLRAVRRLRDVEDWTECGLHVLHGWYPCAMASS